MQNKLRLKPITDAPLFGGVLRLTEQKGVYLIIQAIPEIIKKGGQIVLLGQGEKAIAERLKELEKKYPKHLSVKIGFDEKLAHEIIAGSDVILHPSRFEPCGLTQLYALHYGSLPLVRNVGGLADTVIDTNIVNVLNKTATGFVFDRYHIYDFLETITRVFVNI